MENPMKNRGKRKKVESEAARRTEISRQREADLTRQEEARAARKAAKAAVDAQRQRARESRPAPEPPKSFFRRYIRPIIEVAVLVPFGYYVITQFLDKMPNPLK